jgi:hypothetical protein
VSNCILANSFEELFNIHNSQYNIGLMNVENVEPIDQRKYLENNFVNISTLFKLEIDKNHFESHLEELNYLFPKLSDDEDKMKLINFLKYVISNYADVTDAPVLGITIEKVVNDMCRFFHCDMNSLRLVYPLLGPGTLWVSDENVNRQFLGKGKNELVIKDSNQIFQVPIKTITILKGNGHVTGNNKAIVHASPKISETREKRILLRIESLY